MIRAVALLALTVACGTVPDVTFADPDAADGATEGSVDEAGADSSPPGDASSGCPTSVPSFASACCGPIPCFGANCAATCGDCQLKCSPMTLCCPTVSNKAVCRAGTTCL